MDVQQWPCFVPSVLTYTAMPTHALTKDKDPENHVVLLVSYLCLSFRQIFSMTNACQTPTPFQAAKSPGNVHYLPKLRAIQPE